MFNIFQSMGWYMFKSIGLLILVALAISILGYILSLFLPTEIMVIYGIITSIIMILVAQIIPYDFGIDYMATHPMHKPTPLLWS